MPTFVENFSDRRAWDVSVAANAGPDGGLLQSWLWGEVQRAAGRVVRRVAVLDASGAIRLGWQLFGHRLPLGQSYWYVPRPQSAANALAARQLLDGVRHTSAKQRLVFMRLDAVASHGLAGLGFQPVAWTVQPQQELHVALRVTALELLAAMKSKTRYNIGVAERHGVAVAECSLDEADTLQTFISLVGETAARHGIQHHRPSYYRAIFGVLGAGGVGHLLVASYQGNPLAAALLAACNGVLTYLHGGSVGRHAAVMAPYLLHWHAIQLAQRLQCPTYNFGGVSSRHPAWFGLTRFKLGFSPNTTFVQYGGAWELPLRPGWYQLHRSIKLLRSAFHAWPRKNQ